jgi:hypothetical protein
MAVIDDSSRSCQCGQPNQHIPPEIASALDQMAIVNRALIKRLTIAVTARDDLLQKRMVLIHEKPGASLM